MIKPHRALVAATVAALTVTLLGAPPATADSVNWTSGQSMTGSFAGTDLGNVDFTSAGETFAGWTLTSGVNYQPQVSRSATSGTTTWSLDTATATRSDTRIALSWDGTTGFAVYKKIDAGVRKLFWSRWNGSAWSTGTVLGGTVDDTTPPAVSIRHDGSFGVAAWRNDTGSAFVARFDGTTFASPDVLAGSGNAAGDVSVSVASAADRAIASWITSPTSQLFSRAWNGTSWGSARDVSQNSGGPITTTGRVALSADGTRAMALWVRSSGGHTVRSALGNGDTWQTPTSVSQTYTAIPDVDVALDASGTTAVAAWGLDSGVSGDSIYVQRARFEAGAWTGAAISAGPLSDTTRPQPDVAISDDGSRAVLTFRGKQDSANFVGRAQAFTEGLWGTVIPVGTFNSNPESGRTQIALSRNGTLGSAVVVQQSGGQQSLVRSGLRILTTPGAPQAPVAQIINNEFGSAVRLSWPPVEFTGNLPVEYLVESDPAGPVCDAGPVWNCAVVGMLPGTAYRFRVRATNPFGPSQPSPWSEPVTLPGAPGPVTPGGNGSTAPVVTRITVRQGKAKPRTRKVVVRWSATPAGTSYQVRISRPGGKRWKAWRTVSLPKAVFQLKRKKIYRVAVTAQTPAGTSPVKISRFRVRR